jgi:hypothetical protein
MLRPTRSAAPLPAAWLDFLNGISEPDHYPSPQELDHVLDAWATRGALVETVGVSRGGHLIRCAVIGSGARRMLAWGFPHPDEPIGAAALVALGEGVLAGRLELPDWRLHLILCADPDEAARNLWFDTPNTTAAAFAAGRWSPAHTGVEVDYGFPLTWGPFVSSPHYEGRCRTRQECAYRCGGGPCLRRDMPFAPLPESQALAHALDRYRPELVAAMHNAILGGDYTFLLEREPTAIFDDLIALPADYGRPRQLGESLDRGRRWRRDTPDLIREQRVQEAVSWLERRPGYRAEARYEDCHSAGNYIETMLPGSQFICPEVCYFHRPEFADTRALPETETVLVSVEERSRGRYEVVRVRDGEDWVIAEQRKTDAALSTPVLVERVPTRASLGTTAVIARRRALQAGDQLWERVLAASADEPLYEHPYLDERWAQDTPGRLINGGSLRIFLSNPRYHLPATVAQAATYRWTWPMETAGRLANFQNFLAAQDLTRPELAAVKHELDELQQIELNRLPTDLQHEHSRASALRSQLARVLRLMTPA